MWTLLDGFLWYIGNMERKGVGQTTRHIEGRQVNNLASLAFHTIGW